MAISPTDIQILFTNYDIIAYFDPDLVQAFLKKWGVESDFKAPNLPLSLRLKVSGCHYNSMYSNA
jgi:hypothetical protein